MRLVSSEAALRIMIAVACAGGLNLSALSRAAEAPSSSTKRALEILEQDGFVVRSERMFMLAGSRAADILVRLAEELLSAVVVIRIAARVTGHVEFAGQDATQLLVIFDRAGEPLTESRLASLFERQAERMGLKLRLRAHDDVRRELDVEPERRRLYLGLCPLIGTADEAFPDRGPHGVTTGEPLGRRPHSAVPRGHAGQHAQGPPVLRGEPRALAAGRPARGRDIAPGRGRRRSRFPSAGCRSGPIPAP